MKIKDIRKLKVEETAKKSAELKSELIKLHGQSASGTPPKSPGQIKQIKRTLAKFNTLKREAELREIQQAKQKASSQKTNTEKPSIAIKSSSKNKKIKEEK